MINKKRIIYLILVLSLGFAVVFGYKLNKKIEWLIAKDVIASGGFPYQIGLTGVMVTPCLTTGDPPVCEGGTLCYVKDAGTCTLYADVSGAPAGGMGAKALFLKTALSQAGVTSGSQLIAGGASPVLMDSGVLGGPGGCYNCFARASWTEKIKTKAKYFFKYMIAGWKE
jgi:hypothetical protein